MTVLHAFPQHLDRLPATCSCTCRVFVSEPLSGFDPVMFCGTLLPSLLPYLPPCISLTALSPSSACVRSSMSEYRAPPATTPCLQTGMPLNNTFFSPHFSPHSPPLRSIHQLSHDCTACCLPACLPEPLAEHATKTLTHCLPTVTFFSSL